MSGRKYRMFINEYIANVRNPRYLEIGSWAGSTACSAIYGNAVKATCIDNWSEFGGPRDEFIANMRLVGAAADGLTLIESDFRRVDYSAVGLFNTYLFDGPHTEQDQYDGIRIVQGALQDTFALVVDDWNWRPVRMGTFRALIDEGIECLYSIEVRTTRDNSHPSCAGSESDWHNGYFLCVCRKKG